MRTVYNVSVEIGTASPPAGSTPTWDGREFILESEGIDDLWEFTNAAPPTNTHIRLSGSGGFPSSGTDLILIGEISLSGANYIIPFQSLGADSIVTVDQIVGGTNSVSYKLTSAGVDAGTYWELPVSYLSGTGFTPSVTDPVRFKVFDSNSDLYSAVRLLFELNSTPISGTADYFAVFGGATGLTSSTSQVSGSIYDNTGYLETNVDFRFLGSVAVGNTITPSGTIGRIDAEDDVVAFSTSDIRHKENIIPIDNSLEKLKQIGGYGFDWSESTYHIHKYKGRDIGVIAQEIEKVLPEIVTTRDNGFKAVKYDKLTALLIEAVKELSSQVEDLQDQINKLKE